MSFRISLFVLVLSLSTVFVFAGGQGEAATDGEIVLEFITDQVGEGDPGAVALANRIEEFNTEFEGSIQVEIVCDSRAYADEESHSDERCIGYAYGPVLVDRRYSRGGVFGLRDISQTSRRTSTTSFEAGKPKSTGRRLQTTAQFVVFPISVRSSESTTTKTYLPKRASKRRLRRGMSFLRLRSG
jgi:hypothetical protein